MADHKFTVDLDMGGNQITNLVAPSLGGDATNKTYVDAVAGGAGLAGWYDVTDHGIATANSGATNLTAMNALLTAATANATIWFPPSTSSYQFSGVITIPAKAFRFLGGGQTKSIIQTNHATNNIFAVGAIGTEFVGLRFGTTVTRTGGSAIAAGNFSNLTVSGCYFDAQNNGISFPGGNLGGVDCVVSDCYFSEIVGTALEIQGINSSVRVSNCIGNCTNPGVTDFYINLIECLSFIMSDCRWKSAAVNFQISPNGGIKSVRNVAVSNTSFEFATGESVKTAAGAAGVTIIGLMFDNCRFVSSASGMEIGGATATVRPTGVRFVNCDFLGNTNRGLYAVTVQDFSVSNCIVAGNGSHGIQVAASAGDATKFNISNCTIGPAGNFGANAIGIAIDSGSYGGYTISNNTVRGNTSENNIIDAGTVATTDLKKVINNAGHLLQGQIASNRGAVTSGTGEILLMNARIPADAVLAGQTLRFSVYGQTDAAGTLIFRVRAGAVGTVAGDTTVIDLQDTTVAQAANSWQKYEGLIRVVSTGGSGTVGATGWVTAGTFVTGKGAVAEALATVNMTNPWFIDISCACGTAGVFTVRYGVIEAL